MNRFSMSQSPSRYLYRTGLLGVICALLMCASWAQVAKRAKKSSGPRALGLVEILVNGKARLQTICIMVDGKFFDGGTYKATPVPMSVLPQTVYEGTRNGVSIGLYTIADARAARGSWFGEGKWVPTGSEPKRAPAITSTKRTDDEEAPPILRRSDSPSTKTDPPKPASSKPGEPVPSVPTGADAPPKLKKGDSNKETSAVPESTAPAAPGAGERPILRRSKPGDAPQRFEDKDFASTEPVKEHFLAVSDVAGPEPRSFVLFAKPDDVVSYRKKLEVLASQTVRERYGLKLDAHGAKRGTPSVAFTNAQMQTFDLTNSNDPVIVFTAAVDSSEKMSGAAGYSPAVHATVTVVARVDIYGELRKLLAEATDDHHLDVYPRLEFLDAADADGDGSGELVFRETSDGGSGFVVYRAGLDKVWTVFDSLRNY
jgi:hypothetical protein